MLGFHKRAKSKCHCYLYLRLLQKMSQIDQTQILLTPEFECPIENSEFYRFSIDKSTNLFYKFAAFINLRWALSNSNSRSPFGSNHLVQTLIYQKFG